MQSITAIRNPYFESGVGVAMSTLNVQILLKLLAHAADQLETLSEEALSPADSVIYSTRKETCCLLSRKLTRALQEAQDMEVLP